MSRIEQIANLILANEPLKVRSIVQDWVRIQPRFADEPAPTSTNPQIWAVAAGVIELLAARMQQPAPLWTVHAERLSVPLFLVAAAHKSVDMRARIERESPEPLRKRNVYAPPGYLELV